METTDIAVLQHIFSFLSIRDILSVSMTFSWGRCAVSSPSFMIETIRREMAMNISSPSISLFSFSRMMNLLVKMRNEEIPLPSLPSNDLSLLIASLEEMTEIAKYVERLFTIDRCLVYNVTYIHFLILVDIVSPLSSEDIMKKINLPKDATITLAVYRWDMWTEYNVWFPLSKKDSILLIHKLIDLGYESIK